MNIKRIAAMMIAVSALFTVNYTNAAEEVTVDHFKIEMGGEKFNLEKLLMLLSLQLIKMIT